MIHHSILAPVPQTLPLRPRPSLNLCVKGRVGENNQGREAPVALEWKARESRGCLAPLCSLSIHAREFLAHGGNPRHDWWMRVTFTPMQCFLLYLGQVGAACTTSAVCSPSLLSSRKVRKPFMAGEWGNPARPGKPSCVPLLIPREATVTASAPPREL